ncbi:aldo/keto reductase [Actinomadura macrotermitis]|uniref:Pyridoxine 4-dehydrogenase n=1 Tax=Actinomadura macrotermitis TaxID=2585200 RepID=A0A7K0C808_9ACTN|nr:aldo/keto reductase [Actinomadura macrotermitis]MQY09599.1 Pyridoxine 4-dehydrogenase [Actinomadura macrotermitis]
MKIDESWKLGGDLAIRRMGFGAMRLPGRGRENGERVLRRALELGVDHVDTAAFYFQGDVAANDIIRAVAGPDVVIATKVGPAKEPGEVRPSGQLGAGRLRGEVERNLRELGRDRLDLVYLRPGGGIEPPAGESVAERFEVLAGLREEGLIRHLGLSHVTAAQIEEARAIAPVVAVQNRFDVTQPQDTGLLALCEREGIAYAPYFPLGGFGIPEDARVRAVAARHGATPAQVLLAGLMAMSPVVLAIPGTASVEHAEENVRAGRLELTPQDLAGLTPGR